MSQLDDRVMAKRNPTGLKKIASNTGWLLFDRIFRMGINFFVAIWIARYLGPEQYGLLTFAQSFVALFAVLASLGLEAIVIRNIVNEPLQRYEILGTAFILKLFGWLVTFGLTVVLISLMHPGEKAMITLVTITSLGNLFLVFDVLDYWFQSEVKSKFRVFASTIAFTLVSLLKIFFILQHAPLVFFAYAGVLEYSFMALALLIAYHKNGQSVFKWVPTLKCARNLLRDSWPLILSSLSIMVYMRIDQIMLGEMVGEKALGIYSVAVRLGEMWYFIPIAIVSSTYPSIVNAKKISEQLFYDHLQKLYDVMAIIGYAAAIVVTVLSPYIVMLFGREYREAGPILALYIWIGLFVNLGVARGSFLNTMNYNWLSFFTSLGGAIINVILNLIFIPRYGGIGATVASLISYWFQTHGSCFFFSPLRQTGEMLSRAIMAPLRLKRVVFDIVRSSDEVG